MRLRQHRRRSRKRTALAGHVMLNDHKVAVRNVLNHWGLHLHVNLPCSLQKRDNPGQRLN